MTADVVLVNKVNSICTITINRPERKNALNQAVIRGLLDAVRSAGEDVQTRVIIIRGASQQSFSDGLDMDGTALDIKPETAGEHVSRAIEECPCLVMAMVYGYAIGPGLGLAVACDLRIAADNAHLGMINVKMGGMYHPEGMWRLIQTVGLPRARRMFFTGRLLGANEAREIGLVDWVVPTGQLEKTTYDLAREMADNAPLSMSGTKKAIACMMRSQTLDSPTNDAIQALREVIVRSQDWEEGRRAFAGKRKPVFKGV